MKNNIHEWVPRDTPIVDIINAIKLIGLLVGSSDDLQRIVANVKAMAENLTATQARCTELLLDNRALRGHDKDARESFARGRVQGLCDAAQTIFDFTELYQRNDANACDALQDVREAILVDAGQDPKTQGGAKGTPAVEWTRVPPKVTYEASGRPGGDTSVSNVRIDTVDLAPGQSCEVVINPSGPVSVRTAAAAHNAIAQPVIAATPAVLWQHIKDLEASRDNWKARYEQAQWYIDGEGLQIVEGLRRNVETLRGDIIAFYGRHRGPDEKEGVFLRSVEKLEEELRRSFPADQFSWRNLALLVRKLGAR